MFQLIKQSLNIDAISPKSVHTTQFSVHINNVTQFQPSSIGRRAVYAYTVLNMHILRVTNFQTLKYPGD